MRRAKRMIADYLDGLAEGQTVTVHQIADYVNQFMRFGSVSTGTVSAYCRQYGMKKVGVGVWMK